MASKILAMPHNGPLSPGRHLSSTISYYWALTKPEVNFLILITTGVGFYLGSGSEAGPFSFVGMFNALLGTLLVASGTGTLNQYIERKFDAEMRRTARRPAAAGRLTDRKSTRLNSSHVSESRMP